MVRRVFLELRSRSGVAYRWARRIGGRTVQKVAKQPYADSRPTNGGSSSPTPSLNVLWVTHDEVSLYGLAALLDLVVVVSAYEVCMDVSVAEQRLLTNAFDVCVFPVESYTTQVGDLVERCGAQLILTLPDGEEGGDRVSGDRAVDHWLPQRRISLNALQKVFLRLSGGEAPRLASAPSAERALRILERVTEREREVLRLLSRGQSNQQIARSLGISIHGVKRHVSNLLLKFDCSNRTEVALAASRR